MTWTLSEAQQNAVDSDAPKMCILACAGSGKTTTLTRRIARLINEGEAEASQIAAITFTVLAADKLRAELSRLIERKQAVSEMYIGTIHAFCFELIKLVDPLNADDFSVLDQSRQFVLLNKVWNDWRIQELSPTSKRGDTLEKLQTTIDIVKMEDVSLDVIASRNPLLAEIIASYKNTLRENLYFDFADLLRLAVGSFERHPPFRELVQDKFRWLFVDEYQDVDPLQERLIEHLAQTANLCVVGDDDQAIYQFRGTDVRNIITLAHSLPRDAVFPLEVNLRCRSNIVNTSKAIVAKSTSRLPKEIQAKDTGGVVEARQYAKLQDEIDFIINKIKELRAKLNSYGEIAILMRSLASYGQLYLEALKNAGIPYVSKGDRSLFREPVIQKLRGVLEVIAKEPLQVQHLAELSGLFTVNTQPLATDEREVSSLIPSDWQALGFDQSDLDSLKVVLELYESYLQGNFDTTLEIVLTVIDKLGLLTQTDDPSIFYNVCKLTEIVRDFDEIEQTRRIHRLCAYFSVYASGSFDEATPLDVEADAVQVLTVHQAKGLEFRVVFMPMLVERRFPLSRMSERWFLDNDLFDAARYSTGLDDERRLFYVGATRPQDYLFMTCAREIGLKKPVSPSVFLTEASSAISTLTDSPIVAERAGLSPTTDMPLVTSYSSLEYYLTCPYRYLLLKEYGLATPPNPFFALGRAVHLVARLIHEQGKSGVELGDEAIEQLFHEHLHLTGSQLPPYVMKRRISAVVSALKTYAHEKKDWISKTVDVELPFDYGIPGAVVRGRIDLLVQSETPDAVEIIDWKTGRPHEYLRTDFQMQIYALAAREQLDLNVSKATLHYIEHDTSVEAPIDEAFITEGRANLSSVVQGIRDKRFDATPGSVCTRCECRPICKYRAK